MIDFKYNVLCEMFLRPLAVSNRKMIEICNRSCCVCQPYFDQAYDAEISHINIIKVDIIF